MTMTEKEVPPSSRKQLLPFFLSKAISKSIAVKLAFVLTAVIIVGMGLLSLVILGNQSHVFDQQADAYAAALGAQLSAAAVEPVLAGDIQAVSQLTANLAYNEGIEGVAIFSDQSAVLSTIGIIPKQSPATLFSSQPLHWSVGEKEQTDISSYASSISFEDLTVGYCVLTFNRTFMSAAYANTIRTISAITVLMVGFGVVAAVLISKLLSRPVEQLVEGTREISQGNYKFRFQDSRKDELGQLMKSLNTMTEGLSKKKQVEQTFSRYVSPKVASTLMDDMGKNQLGGSHVEATVLFADISGFTSLSEELEPAAINSLLNDYFTLIDTVAGKHKGHIDKYIGDCAMILFGAPFEDKEHGLHGVQCGVEIQEVIQKYNLSRKNQGMITVDFCVGLNSGIMLAGNMGSERRMEYTVIGNAVNLASRLSSVATAGQVLVTREQHDALMLATLYDTRRVQTIKLRGKTLPVEIWQVEGQAEVLSSRGVADQHAPRTIH